VRSLLSNRLVQVWIVIWIVTRALMVTQVGFWNQVSGVELQDVKTFEMWAHSLAIEHRMPLDENWQYPPGAAFVMLLPRLSGAPFGQSFVVLMLLFELAGLALIGVLAKRRQRVVGVWIWLLAMPLFGSLAVLRLDLVPTVLAIAALVIIHRRPAWFGALAGLGAAIKVWPIVLLFGEWDRRRLLRSAAVAAGIIAVVFAVAAALFGDQSAFFENQESRGIEFESVAATPWFVRNVVTGKAVPERPQHGSTEVISPVAEAEAVVLKWLSLAVLLAASLWWLERSRAVRQGRADLKSPAVSRDFVFTVILLLTVVSRVLSPQFMIWMVGLSAVVLTAGTRRMARPAWIVVFAIIMSSGLYVASANIMLRNLALLAASLDAAVGLTLLLRAGEDRVAGDGGRHLRAGTPTARPLEQP
jgi:Glycosyltransferase family 87